MELFDKLALPIHNYGIEVSGFHGGPFQEKVNLQYRKSILCVKKN